MLAVVGAGLDGQRLELTVRRAVHLVDEHTVGVAGEEVVPLTSPHDLDDVPAGAAEERLQLLDDLAVAAHGPVELLQVAVDDEREVVELLAGGDADGAQGFRLAHLAVTEEGPHALAAGVLDAAVVEIAVEAGLVDGGDGAESHRDRRELPVVRHEPRVRVRRQTVAGAVRALLAEPVELRLGEASLEVGARVDAGGRVTLEPDLVAATGVALAAEEVVEADLVEAGRGLVGGDVAAHAQAGTVGARHHDRGVPADVGANASLDGLVAREPGLTLGRDGVDEVGAAQRRYADVLLAGSLEKSEHHVARTRASALVDHLVERVDPVGRFLGVDVGKLGGETLVDHGWALGALGGRPGGLWAGGHV